MNKIMGLVILVWLAISLGVSGADAAAITSYDEFVAAVTRLSDLLDRATYVAISGFSSYDAEDQSAAAQELVNLLAGPSGRNYKALSGSASDEDVGILALYSAVRTAIRDDWLAEFVSSDTYFVFRDASGRVGGFLELANEVATDALQSRSIFGSVEAFQMCYALLVAARGEFSDPFLVAGIQSLASLLPAAIDDALRPSVQATIDALPAGETLVLEPGTYRERLLITKDITIRGAPQRTDEGEETVLEGVSWDVVITIASDEPIRVVIEDLTIRGGSTGISARSIDEQARVDLVLNDVRFQGNGNALAVEGNSSIACSDCGFDSNNVVVYASENASIDLTRCVIQGCRATLLGSLYLQDASALSMIACRFFDNFGNLIVLAPSASLHLVNCSIEGTYANAIAVGGNDPNDLPCDVFLVPIGNEEQLPSGTITGYGNTIQGNVCPATLLFLTDPAPVELTVAPGESIQAAIDSVADGGVITIEAGTYVEAITIDRSLSLKGASEEAGDVVLDANIDGPVLSISASSPIEIALSDFVFQGQGMGSAIDVGANASVGISGLAFYYLGTAIQVHDGGSVEASHCDFTGNGSTIILGWNGAFEGSWCTFSDNRKAVLSFGSSVCTLTDSTISGCTDDGEAISVFCTDLELRSCTIRDSVGSAIQLGGGEASRLHMTNCDLSGNQIGLELMYGGCNPGESDWAGTPRGSYEYGTISGWSNSFSGFDDLESNAVRNGILYHFGFESIDVTFLTQPQEEE
jgi:parallel beta helix pectate lyase-like protein